MLKGHRPYLCVLGVSRLLKGPVAGFLSARKPGRRRALRPQRKPATGPGYYSGDIMGEG